MSSWINTDHCKEAKKMGGGSEERGGDYIWSKLVTSAIAMIPAARDEDGGRSHRRQMELSRQELSE
jgi:hypothetical protein